MKINIYPIRSGLSHSDVIEISTKYINDLKVKTNSSIDIVDIDSLYENADLSMVLVETGGSEMNFVKILPHLRAPIYLLTHGSNNSLAASIEILSYLRKNNILGEIIHGDIDFVSKRLLELGKPGPILGLIGNPSDWLIGSIVDAKKLRNTFGAELVYIDPQKLIDMVKSREVPVQEEVYKGYQKADLVYNCLEEIAKEYLLDGLTIRCFDLLGTIETTACLALAKLNARGLTAACEGDVPSLLTMYTIREALGLPSFQANPCYIDSEENSIILAHCTLPLNMCRSTQYDTHFESGIGVAIKGELEEKDITLLKIGSDLQTYFISEGKIQENLKRSDLCRTQIKVVLDEDVSYFLKNPLGNHHVIVYGRKKKALEAYLREKGLEAIK